MAVFIFKGVLLMKKAWIVIILATIVLSSQVLTVNTHAKNSKIKLYVDGQELKVKEQARVFKGHSLVPLRVVAEALGAEVQWEQSHNRAIVSKGDTKLIIGTNKTIVHRNGIAEDLAIATRNINGTLMLSGEWLVKALEADVKWNPHSRAFSMNTQAETLPVVGSSEHLKALLAVAPMQENRIRNFINGAFDVLDGFSMSESISNNTSAMDNSAPAAGASGDYSGTNVQVQGVDEADMIKTDGTHIYHISRNRLIITKAYPASEMNVVSSISYTDDNFYPNEIYVDNDHLVVIGNKHYYTHYDYPTGQTQQSDVIIENNKTLPEVSIMPQPYPRPWSINHTVMAMIYDLSDKANLKLLREVEIEGNYISSRKIDDALYLITNKYIDQYRIMEDEDIQAPSFRDSLATDNDNELTPMSYEEMYYFPGQVEPTFLIVAGIDLNDPEQGVNISSYLGSSHNIYASQAHLYTAVSQYNAQESSTKIFKFTLDSGNIAYIGEGEVPGTILNQFSMDEYDDHLRIATTKGEMWRNDEFTSKNNVYILDDALNITGKIEDIAPSERIYSARFMGKRGYMVTFRNVDPLFVLDLENPADPTILGELKIPGYSDYLHPYDEHHLLGFGMDTIEVEHKDNHGNVVNTTALIQGMKMAMFDVSDVANPKEKFKELIGDRGTYSELLSNHKALLFSREKNLLSFPVSIMENLTKSSDNDPFNRMTQFTFQGALVYDIDHLNGFQLRGSISHLTDDELLKAGQYWYDSEKNVKRIIYIGDTLYTISDHMIKANALNNLSVINTLIFN